MIEAHFWINKNGEYVITSACYANMNGITWKNTEARKIKITEQIKKSFSLSPYYGEIIGEYGYEYKNELRFNTTKTITLNN